MKKLKTNYNNRNLRGKTKKRKTLFLAANNLPDTVYINVCLFIRAYHDNTVFHSARSVKKELGYRASRLSKPSFLLILLLLHHTPKSQ
jgi:hypothetical protein